MGFAAAIIIGAGLAGAGIAEMIGGSKNPPGLPSAPALPDPNKASDDAAEKLKTQREILLRAGGQTDLTSGTGVLLGTDVSKETLLGGG